ncbi:pyridoxamine 5'-phosphate oxidase family protein [Agromyces seonyuensis]|uniref:Pyridoxamine 5'-phosphate oxidase N-terminal domain-containing protein n=1 Tax=Agromyces seonyuensis TaxID=2662446 RepID=A0A6I4P436_9MICO|nr:pyridoxamine 5'-phosphate oxidase family protein [Agromyces seonyuensis]MWB98167.1 hypothetical protein [Agromyces seonyuensis]
MRAERMIEYVRAQGWGVLSTVGPEGSPHSAFLELTATDAGELVCNARSGSRKIADLGRDDRVSVVIGGLDGTTLQVEGVADSPAGGDQERCTAAYLAAFPQYAASFDDPGVVLVRVIPNWARHGDYRERPAAIESVDLG